MMRFRFFVLVAWVACFAATGYACAQAPVTPPVDFYALSAVAIDGKSFNFDELRGKKVLIVNTASECGYTPQLAELEKLSVQYRGNLVVIGFPSNNFGAQEPGSNEEIEICYSSDYGVTFMLMAKSDVRGSSKNRVFQWLTEKSRNGWNDTEPSWNFNKFLIDEQGRLIGFFPSKTEPFSQEIISKLR